MHSKIGSVRCCGLEDHSLSVVSYGVAGKNFRKILSDNKCHGKVPKLDKGC